MSTYKNSKNKNGRYDVTLTLKNFIFDTEDKIL